MSFEAKLILHVVFDSEASMKAVGCKSSYGAATISDPRWFSSKDAFMGAVCNAFENMWDEIADGDRAQSSSTVQRAAQEAEGT